MTSTMTHEDWRDALATGDSTRALLLYRSLETQDPATLDALQTCCDVRSDLRAKRWIRARRRLDALPATVSVVAVEVLREQIAALEECSRLLDQRKPEEALAVLEGLDEPLLQAEVETQRGTAFIFMNDAVTAGTAFGRAVANDPRHYRALTNRGNLALEAGRVDDAIADYEAALRLNSEFANAHHNLGVAYRRKGQIGKSVRAIRKAQRALRHEDRDEAREALKSLGKKVDRRWLKYAVYAVVAVVLYFVLRSAGYL